MDLNRAFACEKLVSARVAKDSKGLLARDVSGWWFHAQSSPTLSVWCPRTGGMDCSGHGRCASLSQAGAEWDGRSLRQMPERKTYDAPWAAKKIFGCLCDDGWGGYDCSVRYCTHGADPVLSVWFMWRSCTELRFDMQGDTLESIILECQADDGYFSFFRNGRSAVIPYDATSSDLRILLQVKLKRIAFLSGSQLS